MSGKYNIKPVAPSVYDAMTSMEKVYHDGIVSAGVADAKFIKQSPTYQRVVASLELANPDIRLQQRTNGRGETRREFLARQRREAREMNEKDPPERITNAEVAKYIKRGLDDIHTGKRPNVTGYARSTGATPRHIKAVQTRDKSPVIKAVFAEQVNHPVLVSINNHAPEGVGDMHTGTVSKALGKVRGQYSIAQRMDEAERRLARLEQITQGLLDVATNWHSVAYRMADEGMKPSQIAQALDKSVAAVRKCLQRREPDLKLVQGERQKE